MPSFVSAQVPQGGRGGLLGYFKRLSPGAAETQNTRLLETAKEDAEKAAKLQEQVVFVAGGCTSEIQICDKAVQRAIKAALMMGFTREIAAEVAAKLEEDSTAAAMKVDLSTKRVRNVLAKNLPAVWEALAAQKESIRKAWDLCGFEHSWTADAYEEALDLLKEGKLFTKSSGKGENDGYRPSREGNTVAEEKQVDGCSHPDYDTLCSLVNEQDEAAAEAEDAAAAAKADEATALARLVAVRVSNHGRVVRPPAHLLQ